MEFYIGAIALLSIFFNMYLMNKARKETPQSKRQHDLRILQDLMGNGRSLIEIKRIAPSEFFIRSPRD